MKKIKISAEKIQNCTGKIQKLTDLIDNIFSTTYVNVNVIGTTIALAIPHVIEHKTENKENMAL